MGTKKDIGKLFKERFENLEQAPDAGLWDNIAAELDTATKRRIIPLWYYFGGIAIVAILASIWFMRPSMINATSKDIENSAVQTGVEAPENITKSLLLNTTEATDSTINNVKESNAPLHSAVTIATSDSDSLKSGKNHSQNQTTYIANANSSSAINTTTATSTSQKQYTSTPIKNTDKNNNDTSNASNAPVISSLVDSRNALQLKKEERKAKEEKARLAYEASSQKEIETLITEQRKDAQFSIKERILKKQDSIAKERQKRLVENQNKSSTDKKEPKTPEDREEDRKDAVSYEIAISPYTSLLSYGSLTKASSIDDRLVDNPRDAIPTVGYGVRLDYKLTEKTSLRLGVGYSPLKYRTDNFQVSINNGSINIYELSGINTNNLNEGGTTENTPQAFSFFSVNNVVSIQQNISYIEIPLDVQYRFVNKRISLSVNPGLSVFILDNNEIFATADSGQSIFVGRETNLNELSFAFNLGLGGHYNINKQWRANIEPVFRYQLNPYNNSSSNFRPYYLGAQFGMSYKF